MRGANKSVEVVVIGAGHAGLAISYCLTQRGINHIVLEKGRIGETWRSKRWDSFNLVTPSSTILLPGFNYQGDDPNGFMSRDQFVEHLERYADSFNAPLRCGVNVEVLERNPGGGFLLRLNDDALLAQNVVIATGGHHVAKRPTFSEKLPANGFQTDPDHYRNPESLPHGAVLVVGSGQSGAQISEELHQSGRQVFLSVGRSGRWPRRYRGRDINVWLMEMDRKTIDMMPEPKPRYDSNAHLTGKDGGREINLRQLGREGVTLLGHLRRVEGNRLLFEDDLEENLLKADERVVNVKKAIDEFVLLRGLDVPMEEAGNDVAPGEGTPPVPILEIDLSAAGISTIVWATGYCLDFNWVRLPVLDNEGFPLHTRGVSVQEGLYFLGLPWLYRATSSGVIGVGEDALHIADHLASGLKVLARSLVGNERLRINFSSDEVGNT